MFQKFSPLKSQIVRLAFIVVLLNSTTTQATPSRPLPPSDKFVCYITVSGEVPRWAVVLFSELKTKFANFSVGNDALDAVLGYRYKDLESLPDGISPHDFSWQQIFADAIKKHTERGAIRIELLDYLSSVNPSIPNSRASSPQVTSTPATEPETLNPAESPPETELTLRQRRLRIDQKGKMEGAVAIPIDATDAKVVSIETPTPTSNAVKPTLETQNKSTPHDFFIQRIQNRILNWAKGYAGKNAQFWSTLSYEYRKLAEVLGVDGSTTKSPKPIIIAFLEEHFSPTKTVTIAGKPTEVPNPIYITYTKTSNEYGETLEHPVIRVETQNTYTTDNVKGYLFLLNDLYRLTANRSTGVPESLFKSVLISLKEPLSNSELAEILDLRSELHFKIEVKVRGTSN